MLIWTCGLNLQHKSPHGNQDNPIWNSWGVDLVLFEPANKDFTELKQKVNQELHQQDRSWHNHRMTAHEIELDQMRKAGYGEQKFIVKHLHPWWNSYQGGDDYEQLFSLAMAVYPFNFSKLKSENSLAFALIVDVAQLVRIINSGSVLGGQTFDVDPERFIPVISYSNDEEDRYQIDDSIQRKDVNVQQNKFFGVTSMQTDGWTPNWDAFNGRDGTIDGLATKEQNEQKVIDTENERFEDITNGKLIKGPLGKFDVDKLKPLKWTYDKTYQTDKNSRIKYFLTDVNDCWQTNIAVEAQIYKFLEKHGGDMDEFVFDFGLADLNNAYFKIKDKKIVEDVEHWKQDENGKWHNYKYPEEIAWIARKGALYQLLKLVRIDVGAKVVFNY